MCTLCPEVHTKTMKGENLGLTYKFSVHACEIAERERRRGPRAPWLGEMGDLGADKDSLWSAQTSVSRLCQHVPWGTTRFAAWDFQAHGSPFQVHTGGLLSACYLSTQRTQHTSALTTQKKAAACLQNLGMSAGLDNT